MTYFPFFSLFLLFFIFSLLSSTTRIYIYNTGWAPPEGWCKTAMVCRPPTLSSKVFLGVTPGCPLFVKREKERESFMLFAKGHNKDLLSQQFLVRYDVLTFGVI